MSVRRTAYPIFGGSRGQSPLFEAPITDGRAWRPIGSSSQMTRDLTSANRGAILEKAQKARVINPLARRLIKLRTDFVLGNGFTLSSSDDTLIAEIRDNFWLNSYNAWPERILPRMRDLYVTGEWIHRPYTSGIDGMTYIADVPSTAVSAVLAHKMDIGVVDAVVLRSIYSGTENIPESTVPVIRRRLNFDTVELDKYMTGGLFYFGLNRTTDQPRGDGDLTPLLDMLDILDQILFTRASRVQANNQIYWDLEIQGMGEAEMQRYVKEQQSLPPQSGSVWAHNPGIKMEAKVPDLRGADFESDASGIKGYITGTDGWPGTWVDDPGSAGRAVGAEMSEPAERGIASMQQELIRMLRCEIDYFLQQRQLIGGLKFTDATKYTLIPHKPTAKSITKLAPALSRIGTFLDQMKNANFMTQEECRGLLVGVLGQSGIVDIDIDFELPEELRTRETEYRTLLKANTNLKEVKK